MRYAYQRLNGGSAPATPGFNALRQNGHLTGRLTPPRPFRPLSRRSGRIPALPYTPLRSFQSGRHQPRRAMISHRTAITPLTSCLTTRVHFSHCLLYVLVDEGVGMGILLEGKV